jgi:hypothetical protein
MLVCIPNPKSSLLRAFVPSIHLYLDKQLLHKPLPNLDHASTRVFPDIRLKPVLSHATIQDDAVGGDPRCDAFPDAVQHL